jgi:hypothetical protein
MAFRQFISDEALNMASSTRDRINKTFVEKTQVQGGADILPLEDALQIDNEFMEIGYKPSQWTLLHRFIQIYYIEEWYYSYRKWDDFTTYTENFLNQHNISYRKEENINSDYDWYLYNQVINASNQVIHETFCILFEDRELMRLFSLLVAEPVSKLLINKYPEFLKKDGQFKRYSNWNQWLRTALFHRENGCCSICKTNLTGIFSIEEKLHIDHIVPISKGGTNDPTNLQILCEECNLKKGNRNTNTGVLRYIPWELK